MADNANNTANSNESDDKIKPVVLNVKLKKTNANSQPKKPTGVEGFMMMRNKQVPQQRPHSGTDSPLTMKTMKFDSSMINAARNARKFTPKRTAKATSTNTILAPSTSPTSTLSAPVNSSTNDKLSITNDISTTVHSGTEATSKELGEASESKVEDRQPNTQLLTSDSKLSVKQSLPTMSVVQSATNNSQATTTQKPSINTGSISSAPNGKSLTKQDVENTKVDTSKAGGIRQQRRALASSLIRLLEEQSEQLKEQHEKLVQNISTAKEQFEMLKKVEESSDPLGLEDLAIGGGLDSETPVVRVLTKHLTNMARRMVTLEAIVEQQNNEISKQQHAISSLKSSPSSNKYVDDDVSLSQMDDFSSDDESTLSIIDNKVDDFSIHTRAKIVKEEERYDKSPSTKKRKDRRDKKDKRKLEKERKEKEKRAKKAQQDSTSNKKKTRLAPIAKPIAKSIVVSTKVSDNLSAGQRLTVINFLCVTPEFDIDNNAVVDLQTFLKNNFQQETKLLNVDKRRVFQQSIQSGGAAVAGGTSNPTLMSSNTGLTDSARKIGKAQNCVELQQHKYHDLRWWETVEFTGTVYKLGAVHLANEEQVSNQLILLGEAGAPPIEKYFEYIRSINPKASGLEALGEPRPINQFKERSTYVSCGFNTTAMLSELGEVSIMAAKGLQVACLGKNCKIEDWSSTFVVDKILGRRIIKIECGPFHFAAITEADEVILWGINCNLLYGNCPISGQLARKDVNYGTPVKVSGLKGKPFDVACGWAHTAVLTNQGLFTCGANDFGQLGHDNDTCVLSPVVIANPNTSIDTPVAITQIDCGAQHTVGLTVEGLVYSWGGNSRGQCGLGYMNKKVTAPQLIMSIDGILLVAAGSSHTAAVRKGGLVFTWGGNGFGELGLGDNAPTEQPKPTPLASLQDEEVQFITCGPHSTAAITTKGDAWVWGMLSSKNFVHHQHIPTRLDKLHSQHVFIGRIACGTSHLRVMTDTKLSVALQAMSKACINGPPNNLAPLKTILMSITTPKKLLHNLQERAVATHIEASANSAQQITAEKLAWVTGSCAYYNWVLQPKKSNNTLNVSSSNIQVCDTSPQELVLTNQSQVTIVVKAVLDNANARYSFVAEPNFCTVPPLRSATFQISCLCNSLPNEEINSLITFHISPDCTAYSSSADTSNANSEQASSFFYVFCTASAPIPKAQQTKAQQQARNTRHPLQDLVSALSTYVPTVLLDQFRRTPTPPSAPKIRQFPAAILFIDISGFTSLNERLAALGSKGPELVSKHINNYFSSLITVVNEHGGDVLKFAGDALICMFRCARNREPLASLTLRAVQCGFEIQTNLKEYDSNEGFQLTLHIGIGSGSLFSLYVGGHDGSWEYLVSGEPLAQLRTAVDNSHAGEVVVSKESWQLIKDKCEGEPRANDYYVKAIVEEVNIKPTAYREPPVKLEAALRCFIPKAVQHRLDSKQIGWMDELRTATILFVKLNSEFDYKKMDSYCDRINNILVCMQKVIFKLEGMVRQFLSDDKGTVLIAAFGLPPFSHGDDSLRAVRASLQIHRALNDLGMRNTIGLTTGRVYCGSVGSQKRQEYAMVGDVVNLSARLMVAAEKQGVAILCDQPTYNGSCASVAYDTSLPAIMVKGKKMPIQIFVPKEGGVRCTYKDEEVFGRSDDKLFIKNLLRKVSSTTSSSGTGKLQVTRSDVRKHDVFSSSSANLLSASELSQKRRRSLEHSQTSDNAKLIIIEGEEGIGKSNLVAYAVNLAKTMSIATFIGRGESIYKTEAFHMWCTVVADLIGIDTSLDSKETTASVMTKVATIVSPQWIIYTPLLQAVIPEVHLPENHATKKLTESERNKQTSQLVAEILLAYAKATPLLLIFEDIHWADTRSLFAVLEVAKKQAPKLIVLCTTRPMAPPLPLPLQKLNQSAAKLPLSALQPRQCLLLAKLSLGITNEISQPLVDIILQMAKKLQGNPLFIKEMALGFLESGLVAVDADGNCGIVDESKIPCMLTLPASVVGVINSRLDRLTASTQMVLKVASVIGTSFSLEAVREVYPVVNERKFVEQELKLLANVKLINQVEKSGRDVSYNFESKSVEEVAYSRLLFAQRRQLHEAVAMYYESQFKHAKGKQQFAYAKIICCNWNKVVNGGNTSNDLMLKAIKWTKLTAELALAAAGNKPKNAAYATAQLNKCLQLIDHLPESDEKKVMEADLQNQLVKMAFNNNNK